MILTKFRTARPDSMIEIVTDSAAAARRATAVLSGHTRASSSATVASAAIAADTVDIPVRVVDTGEGSFPVALAVWAAAEVLDDGGTIQDAAAAADRTATGTGSLFVVGVPAVARRGGRFVAVGGELTPTTCSNWPTESCTIEEQSPTSTRRSRR